MKKVADEIPAYTYGTTAIAVSEVSLGELEKLKVSAGFTIEDEQFLRLAGEVLAGQTKQIVDHWRSGIIAGIRRCVFSIRLGEHRHAAAQGCFT